MMPELTQEQVTREHAEDGDEAERRQIEARLARWVHDRWDEAEAGARQEADRQSWDDWIDNFWGQAPPEGLPAFRQPVLTTEMRDLILREAQEITDARPRIHVTGAGVSAEITKLAEKLLQAKWEDADVRGATRDAVIWSKILPCGYLGVYWDPFLKDGLGDIAVCAEDPRAIAPAPESLNDIIWPYVCKEDWMDLYLVAQRWPDTGSRVTAETPPVQSGARAQKSRSSPYLGPMFSLPGKQPTGESGIPQARVVSCWVRDPTTEIIPEEIKDPQTGQVVKIVTRQVQKYPRGRLVQVAGNVVLSDQPWRVSSFPIFRVLSIPAIGTFWPASLVRDLTPTQQAVDTGWQQIIENMERVNECGWFTTGKTGIDPNNFAAVPGFVVEGEPGSTMEAKGPPPFPESFIRAPELLAGIMRRKLGMSEARAGNVTGANIGQGLIESEIAQAEAPTRLTATLLYQTLRRVAQHILETLGLMYRVRRHVPMFGSGGTFEQIEWHPVDEETVARMITHLDPSSLKPRSEMTQKNMILALLKMGKYPLDLALEQLEVPDAKEAAEKMKQELILLAAARQRMPGGKKR